MNIGDEPMNTFGRHLFSYFTALLTGTLAISSTLAEAPGDRPVVTGTFLGDGKDAGIKHLVVQTREPFSDKPAIRLIFTEKNPSSSKKPDFDAAFKKLGSALIISVDREGGIFGCEVAHTSHPKSPFSALGEIKMKDFKVTDTQVSGTVTTGKELDAFGQKWQVDLTFTAPLPKGAFAGASEPAVETKPTTNRKDEEQPVATGPKPPVSDLPLPSNARNVEYKKIVEQIAFQSDASVSAVAADFSAKLKQKGWKDSSGSLMGKANAILRRKLDAAELTIMVKPSGTGSAVTVISKGLDWTNPPASAPATPVPGGTGLDAEANRLINDALKMVPGGLK